MDTITRRELLHGLLINSGLAFTAASFIPLIRTPISSRVRVKAEQGQVTSKDGTRISFQRTGSGPPLVLVHGTSSDSTRWAPVLPALGAKFTVYAMERRGRGASGDAPTFSFEREIEDVVALVDSIREPVNLLGHSYGGICCLEALLRTKNIRKLIIYEAPIGVGDNPQIEQIDARIDALIEKGDREKALLVFQQEIVGVPLNEINLMRSATDWNTRVAIAPTIPRERKAQKNYQFKAERFQNAKTPTLLLLGGDSPHRFVNSTEMIKSALSTSQIVIMPGQRHNAMFTAPGIFTGEVISFLSA